MDAARICPECGEEYLPTVQQCVDCGVPLVAEGSARADVPRELPPAAQLSCVRTATLAVAQGLSQRLSEEGISHRIEVISDEAQASERRRPAELPYGVYVRAADLASAARVDRDYLSSVLPDLPEAGEAAADGGCPACGAAVEPDATECSDCGLALLETS